MSGDDLYDLIQGQILVFADNVMHGNRVFQVYAVTSCVLAEGVDIGGNIRLVNRAEFDSLKMLFLSVQRQGIFTVTMHQL